MTEERKIEWERMGELVDEIYGARGGIRVLGRSVSLIIQDKYGGHATVCLSEEQVVALVRDADDRLNTAHYKFQAALEDYDHVVRKEKDRVNCSA